MVSSSDTELKEGRLDCPITVRAQILPQNPGRTAPVIATVTGSAPTNFAAAPDHAGHIMYFQSKAAPHSAHSIIDILSSHVDNFSRTFLKTPLDQLFLNRNSEIETHIVPGHVCEEKKKKKLLRAGRCAGGQARPRWDSSTESFRDW